MTGSGLLRYKIRPLNVTKICTVAEKDLEHIDPEPTDIPLKPSDMDNKIMTHWLSSEDIEKLWSGNVDNTLSDNDMITMY